MVVVAKIGGAHGLRGEVRVRFFSDDPEGCCQRGPLYPKDDSHAQPMHVLSFRHGNTMSILHFEGIADRAAAEKLNGILLFQPRELFSETAEDEYYYADLIGMAVVKVEGNTLIGTVVDVYASGASDILVVKTSDGKTTNIPFISAAVPEVDREKKTIMVLAEFIP